MTTNPVIYEPGGRAREYSALACNLWDGCTHRCAYCYSPLVCKKRRDDFHAQVRPRKDILERLHAGASRRQQCGDGGQVLLCFSCDPYPPEEFYIRLTARAIHILHHCGHAVCILTKGVHANRDFDLLGSDDAFAVSLTTLDVCRALRWEPGAAHPAERMMNLRVAHRRSIPTWISLEPIIGIEDVLNIIHATHTYTDHYKLGKLNYFGVLPPKLRAEVESIDWQTCAQACVSLLETLGYTRSTEQGIHTPGTYYVKHSLAKYLDAKE